MTTNLDDINQFELEIEVKLKNLYINYLSSFIIG